MIGTELVVYWHPLLWFIDRTLEAFSWSSYDMGGIFWLASFKCHSSGSSESAFICLISGSWKTYPLALSCMNFTLPQCSYSLDFPALAILFNIFSMEGEQRVVKPDFNDLLNLLKEWQPINSNDANNSSSNSILCLDELTSFFGMSEYWVFNVLFFILNWKN